MGKREELRKLIRAYVSKTQEPLLPYATFRSFLEKYLEKYPEELKELSAVKDELDTHLSALISELENEKIVDIITNPNGIKTLRYIEYYRNTIEQRYRFIQNHPDAPLPSEQSFQIVFPIDIVTPVEVQTDFISYLGADGSQPSRILRILFPDLSKNLLVTTPVLEKILLEICIQKIRQYLRDQKNAMYIQHKLVPLFRGRERILKDQILSVITKPDMTFQDILHPTDFIFQFWSQTSSFLIKEVLSKKEKLEEEIDLAQAAYLLGTYAIFFKGEAQKERDSETSLRLLGGYFEKPPYAYTFHDIYSFKDPKGFPLMKKLDTASLQTFLDEKTTPRDAVALPDIIKVKAIDKKEYFIAKTVVARFLLERSFSLFREIRQRIIQDWYEALESNEKRKEFKEESAFEKYTETILKELDPLFYSLLNFSLLFLILEQVKPPQMEKEFLDTLLDRKGKRIQPISRIFRLHKEDLLAEAKLKLPFWKTLPVLKQVVQFFIRFYSTSPKVKPKKSTSKKAAAAEQEETAITLGPSSEPPGMESGVYASEKARKARFQEEIEALKVRALGNKGEVSKELPELIDLWNPLIDPTAKANLVEDVNSLVRDFLRKLKILSRLQAPSLERLEKLAEELTAHEALQKIRNKEPLRRYILLYMLEVLGKVR